MLNLAKIMTIKFKNFFIILLIGFFQLAGAEETPVYYSSDDLKVSFTESGEIKEVLLEGNVKILYQDIVIKCEKASFDRINGEVEGEGTVEIESEFGKFTAGSFHYNLYDNSGILFKAAFSSPPIYGKAEKIEKEKEIFFLKNGYFTTCELEKPHYRFACDKIEYVPEKYVRAERVRLVFGKKFNVFYLPRATFNLKTKKPPLLVVPGYRTHLGRTLSLIFNNQLKKDSDFIASERIDLNDKGAGLGIEIYSEKENVKFKEFSFKRWDEDGLKTGAVGEFTRAKENRYGNFNFIANWRWMEDNEFFNDYFPQEYYEKSKNYNYFSISQQFPSGFLNLLVREKAREEFLQIEKLPELRFYTPFLQISDAPVYFSNNFQLTRFSVENEDEYLRILESFSLTHKKNLRFFSLKTWASLSLVDYYTKYEEKFNCPKELGVELSTLFKKNYGKNIEEFFSPSISLLLRGANYKSSQLPYFDINESFENGKYMSLDLDWNFWKENNYLGRISIENLYDINRDNFSETYLKYEGNLTNYVSVQGENSFDFGSGDINFGVNDVTFEKNKIKCSVGTRYLKDEIWGMENWFESKFRGNWKYRLGFYYDFKHSNLTSQSYEIWRKLHCWVVNFKISRDENDTSFYVVFVPTIFAEQGDWKRRFTKWR